MDFVEFRSFDNAAEANTVLKQLQRARINCFLSDPHIISGYSRLNPVIGGLKLMVHHSQVETAWELMEQAEDDYLKKIPCPVCHSYFLKRVSITRDHRCKLSALVSMVLNGHSVEINKKYQCGRCGYDFTALPGQARS
jgi:predicted RNA-binding Zn-ribbon protein involved in translation (DUF1610 family)